MAPVAWAEMTEAERVGGLLVAAQGAADGEALALRVVGGSGHFDVEVTRVGGWMVTGAEALRVTLAAGAHARSAAAVSVELIAGASARVLEAWRAHRVAPAPVGAPRPRFPRVARR